MKRNLFFAIVGLIVLFLGGQFSAPIQRVAFREKLNELAQIGHGVRFIDNETVEVSDRISGATRKFTLREPTTAQILAWADTHGVPVITIDPNTIDTSRFTGWYRYWTQVPVANSFLLPPVIGDVNRNGRKEAYGIHRDFNSIDFETRAYEIDSLRNPTFVHNYGMPRPGGARSIIDADSDGLDEVLFSGGGFFSNYEQSSLGELPTSLRFVHRQFYGPNGAGATGILGWRY